MRGNQTVFLVRGVRGDDLFGDLPARILPLRDYLYHASVFMLLMVLIVAFAAVSRAVVADIPLIISIMIVNVVIILFFIIYTHLYFPSILYVNIAA